MKALKRLKIKGVVFTTCVWCGMQIPWTSGKPPKCPHCGKPI